MSAATRAGQRYPNRLVAEHGAVIEADRRFFERFPHRTYRVRHLSIAEVTALEGQGRSVGRPASGWRWFVAIKQVLPGCRMRIAFQSPEGAEVDLPEELAAGLYSAAQDANHTGLGYGVISPGDGR